MLETYTNSAVLVGDIKTCADFSHKKFGVDYFTSELEVFRKSGKSDILPLLIPGTIITPEFLKVGDRKLISAELVTEDRFRKNGSKYIYPYLQVNGMETTVRPYENYIELDGWTVNRPNFRRAKNSDREVCNLLIANNTAGNGGNYINVTLWGAEAVYAADFVPGMHIAVTGRIQEHLIRRENRITHEISCSTMMVL